jgi:hypothetical protein
MIRKYSLSAFAVAIAFLLGLSFSYRPVSAADAPAGKGKCISLTLGGQSGPNSVKLYRTFEDGTVEWCVSDSENMPWMRVGK